MNKAASPPRIGYICSYCPLSDETIDNHLFNLLRQLNNRSNPRSLAMAKQTLEMRYIDRKILSDKLKSLFGTNYEVEVGLMDRVTYIGAAKASTG